MSKSNLVREWERISDDLGVRIITPVEVDLGDNEKVTAELLVLDFGGRRGTLVITAFSVVKPYLEKLRLLGYGFSVLDEPREDYDREATIDMLSEWGWTGEQPAPDWVKDVDTD